MSSAAGTEYWCHRCNRTVRPSSGGGEDVRCPLCSDGFVEEVGNDGVGAANFEGGGPLWPMPTDHAFMHTDVFGTEGGRGGGPHAEGGGGIRRYLSSGQRSRGLHGHGQQQPAILQVLDAMSAVLQQIQTNPNQQGQGMEGGGPDGEGGGGIGEGGRGRMMPPLDGGGGQFNPMFVFQGMPNFMGGAGGNVEVFFDSGNGTPRRLPANIGDYFLGPGMDQLIQQLAENDPNRYGAPPASKSAVEAMPTIQIQEEHMGTDAAQCAVCKDEFELGSRVRQMPCKHLYHPDCILPWLAQHNSCPVCRYEMPTDDPDYNSNRPSRTTITIPPMSAPHPVQSPVASEGGAPSGGAFTMWGGQGGYGGRYGSESATGRESSGVTGSSGSTVASSGPAAAPAAQAPPSSAGTTSSGSSGGSAPGRRMSIFPLPSWLFRSSNSSSNAPPAGGGQAETSRQGGAAAGGNRSSINGSSGSGRQGQSSSRTDEDGDILMSEAKQEDLD